MKEEINHSSRGVQGEKRPLGAGVGEGEEGVHGERQETHFY